MPEKSVVMVLTKDILIPYLDIRVYKEVISLIHHGFHVTVLCRVYSLDEVENEEEYDGFTIIRHLCDLPKKEFNSRIEQLFQNFKNVRSMAKRIVQLKPDIIHAHDLNALFECVLAKRKLKVPLIYDSHEDWPKLELNKGNKLTYLSALLYENCLLSHVDQVITVNQSLAKKFKTKKPTSIIYNYPSTTKFIQQPMIVKKIQDQYNLQDKIVVEYHGVIGPKKGIEMLLDIAIKLLNKYEDLRFLIMGPGHEKYSEDINRKKLDKRIIFTGQIDYKLIPSYIAVSDISFLVLQPIEQYLISLPTKLFEAMLMSKPVIANAEFPENVRVFGNAEKDRLGILVNYDVQEIMSALIELIQNKEHREKYGRNGRAKVVKYYSWENQEKELIQLYQSI